MRAAQKIKNQLFLKENGFYVFRVIKRITLPDESRFFVLESPFNTRHLLPAEFYEKYDIMPGKNIRCRVDKINCVGRIFLEPGHPYLVPLRKGVINFISMN